MNRIPTYPRKETYSNLLSPETMEDMGVLSTRWYMVAKGQHGNIIPIPTIHVSTNHPVGSLLSSSTRQHNRGVEITVHGIIVLGDRHLVLNNATK